MFPIKLAIADDHKIYRKGLIAAACREQYIKAVAEADRAEELPGKIKTEIPDVIIAGVNKRGDSGPESIRFLRSAFSHVKILAMASSEDENFIISLLQAGANGFLQRDADPDEIEKAVQSVIENAWYFNEHISSLMLKAMVDNRYIAAVSPPNAGLSRSEVSVLKLICQQYTNPQIADKLNMGVRTVDGHRNRILNKTGAKNTAGLVMFAVKNGIAEI